MRIQKRNYLPFLVMGVVITVVAIVALRGHGQSGDHANSYVRQQREDFDNQFPITDLQDADALTPAGLEKRRKKSKRYGGYKNAVGEQTEVITSSRHWAAGLDALPVLQSDAVVIGHVKNSQALLTEGNAAVYSEFELQIENVLKNDKCKPLASGEEITVEREGGRIRTRSGRVGISFTVGMGMPRTGKRYLFFLSHQFPEARDEEGRDFYIVTAYELKGGLVYPIDSPGGGTHLIASKYKSASEATLLKDLQTALNQENLNPHK